MSNVIKKGGLRLKNAGVDQPLMTCLHDSADANPLGIGDPVKASSAGANQIGNGPFTMSVTLVSAGDAIFGVVEGVLREFVTTGMNLDSRYAPASTEMYVLVRRANTSDVYAITEDSAGGSVAQTNVGTYLANLTGNGGGTSITTCDTVTGQSTVLLDSSTAATTTTLQVKTLGYEDTVDNTAAATNSSILVRLNHIDTTG